MADRSLFWYFVILLAIFSEINGFPLCPKSTSLLPCIVGMTKVMNFRLHIDIIRFFDEYITGRAKIIRKNDLTHQETLLLNEQMTRNLHVRFLKGIYYSLHMYVCTCQCCTSSGCSRSRYSVHVRARQRYSITASPAQHQ